MARKFNCTPATLVCLLLASLMLPFRCAALPQNTPAQTVHHASTPHKTAASQTMRKSAAYKIAASKAAKRNTAAGSRSTTLATHRAATLRTSTARSKVSATAPLPRRTTRGGGARTVLAVRRTRRGAPTERFYASSYSDDLTLGDVTAGEDPVVRAAAIEALGNMNGTALAIDPSSGRILAMVNQKLALSSGAEPCSTIKLAVALAALDEGLITRDTPVNLGGHYTVNLTKALALSINPYFETLGRMMGFERVKHYANQFGLGELAGYNIDGEQLGAYPDTELPAAEGGVGRMCSFGESISMTPLQLGALVSAIANGGTLYYLQHPQTADEVASFVPRVKRLLDIAPLIPEIKDGMEGAVDYGTARSLRVNFHEFPVLGKTGTCSDNGTRFGWFASYADAPTGRIVTVIFLEGGKPTFGPRAAELTGQLYRGLWDRGYFQPRSPQLAGAFASPANP